MLGHLYRYPHPHDANRFIYCGQGPKRDKQHRSGRSSFGRRFKINFPGVELPQPIREAVEVKDQLELNELETIWMFQYHTWRGYEGGMNMNFPGPIDYKEITSLGGLSSGPVNGQFIKKHKKGIFALEANGLSAGANQGRKNVESGHLARLRTPENQRKAGSAGGKIGGIIAGRKRVESGFFDSENQRKAGRIGGKRVHELHPELASRAGRIAGRKNVESGHLERIRHEYQHIQLNRFNPRCVLCSEQNLVVAYA